MTAYFFSNFQALCGRPSDAALTPQANTALLQSSLSYGTQVISRPGGRFALTLTWNNVYGDRYRELMAMLTLLNGAEHTMDFAPADIGLSERGDWGGSPVVDGGSQTGNTLAVRGADTSTTDWAKAGDLFRIADTPNYLHMVTADADSDGSGDVSLGIWPEMRGSYADAAVLSVNQGGSFRLVDSASFPVVASASQNDGGRVATVTASFVDTSQP